MVIDYLLPRIWCKFNVITTKTLSFFR